MTEHVIVREFNEIIDRVLISRRRTLAALLKRTEKPAIPAVVAGECLDGMDQMMEELLIHCKREQFFVPNIDGYLADILELYFRDIDTLTQRFDPDFSIAEMRRRIDKDIKRRLFLVTKGIVRRKYIYKPTLRSMFTEPLDRKEGAAKTLGGGIMVACAIAAAAWLFKHKLGL